MKLNLDTKKHPSASAPFPSEFDLSDIDQASSSSVSYFFPIVDPLLVSSSNWNSHSCSGLISLRTDPSKSLEEVFVD